MLKLVIDKDIPFINGVFEPYAKVVYMKGADINSSDVQDADGLIIRTRTKCNSLLLNGSAVKFIASATIGEDHVDKEYCKANGISFTNAIGCNALGVMQYVYTSLFYVVEKLNINILPLNSSAPITIGVIGCGHVGTEVAKLGRFIGLNVLMNDPIKEKEFLSNKKEGDINPFVPLEYLLKNSDIVSLHPSLNETSLGLADKHFFENIKNGAILINASRGEVLNDEALLAYRNKLKAVVLDVWNNEPNISTKVLDACTLATPHLAGYSVEGKVNGTQMVVKSTAEYFNIEQLKNFAVQKETSFNEKNYYIDFKNLSQKEITVEMLRIFPILEQDYILRKDTYNFENQRSNYRYRREFNY